VWLQAVWVQGGGGKFRLNTTGSCWGARLYLDKQYNSIRLVDLQYLSRIFHVIQNQFNAYTLSLPDVVAYTTTKYIWINFIETPPNASKHILYAQLFEDLKTILGEAYSTLHTYTLTYYCLTVL